MKDLPRFAASALVALSILFGGAAFHPSADAAYAGTPNFAVKVGIEYVNGTPVTGNGADFDLCPLKIIVDVSLAEGQPDSPNTTIFLDITGEKTNHLQDVPLYVDSSPGHVFLNVSWMPAGYGKYDMSVRVYNNMSYDNHTELKIDRFTVRDSDLRLSYVSASPADAVIGVTEVSISAYVSNVGNEAGFASVDFFLDGKTSIGIIQDDVGPGGGFFRLWHIFSVENITEGAHSVTACLTDLVATRETSGTIRFRLPFSDLQVTGLEVFPEEVAVPRGAVVPVDLTATVRNYGNIPSPNFTVVFFDNTDRLATVAVNRSIGPGESACVTFGWDVTDALAPGMRTLRAGMDGENPLDHNLPGAALSIYGVPSLSVEALVVSPESEYEGEDVELRASIVNEGTADATGVTVEFWLEDPAGGPPRLLGHVDNLSIPAGMSDVVWFDWTLPAVGSGSETRIVRAVVGDGALGTVSVVILKKRAIIGIERLDVPEGLRVGDTATFSALVRNAGNLPATGVVVDFYDGNSFLGTSGPFDLPSGSSRDVRVSVKIPGAGDAVHALSARAGNATSETQRTVGHRLAPANIEIASFNVTPGEMAVPSGAPAQELTLELVLRNTGELPGTAIVAITDNDQNSVVLDLRIAVAPGEATRTFSWIVKGEGPHTAVVTVRCGDRSDTSSVTAVIRSAPPEADLLPFVAFGTAVVIVLVLVLARVARNRSV